jgi:shikimate kinase
MKTLSIVHGAISIVNAIATGKGSALGISLETCAEVTLTSDNLVEVIINNDKSENTGLAQECFKLVKMKTSESCGAKITVNSDIPIGRGLKSSSAAATAIILSCLKAFEITMTEKEILDLSVQASKNSGVTITGALDDTAACFLGGLVVTNNLSNELLSRVIVDDDYSILIHVPDHKSYTKDVDYSGSDEFIHSLDTLISMTLEGNYLSAMSLNGMIYSRILKQSNESAILALKNNALAAGLSGTGPSVGVICLSENKSSILDSWKNLDGDIINAKINNGKGL